MPGRLARVSVVAAAPAFAAPGKRCWSSVPGAETSFDGNLEFVHCQVVHPVIHASVQYPKERLRHVQPRSAEWRVQRHDYVSEQPGYDRGTQVSGQIVPDQDESEWW